MFGELPEIDTNTPGVKTRGYPVRIESSPTGPKLALLRLPTADEEIKYFSAQRTIYKDLGRGVGEWEDLPTPKADLALFKSIRTDQGVNGDGPVDFDEAEAKYAISCLLRNQVTSCERDGDSYTVKLATVFGETIHTLRIPYHVERQEYQTTVIKSRDMPHNITERRMPIEVPVKLYDRIVRMASGYIRTTSNGQGGQGEPIVPPHHKRSVVYAVMADLALLDPGLDPNS